MADDANDGTNPDSDDGSGPKPNDGTDPDNGDADAPLSDLAREMRERRERREREGDVVGGDDDLFEQVDVGDIDSEAAWEALVEAEAAEQSVGVDRDDQSADAPETEQDGETLVSKRAYCQRCPHFTEPPDVACTHEGTDIVEVVDTDTFRVRDCPMVTEGEEPPQFE